MSLFGLFQQAATVMGTRWPGSLKRGGEYLNSINGAIYPI